MNRTQRLLEEVYNEARENIYLSENIIDFDELDKFKDDLINRRIYIPNLLRGYFGLSYISLVFDDDDIMKKIHDMRDNSYEENVIEFINWVDDNEDFESLILEDKVNLIADRIEDLEKEYNEYYNKLN